MSAQRRSGRKRAANTRISDLPDSSPSQRSRQTAKRRKPNPTSRPRAPRRQRNSRNGADDVDMLDNDTEDEDGPDDEIENSFEDDSQELTELAIRHLDVAPEPVAVAEAYKSELWDQYGKDIQAFAKISGKSWTYFVTEVKIVIGRQPEDSKDGDPDKVHIDLGPNKMISRHHAELFYDPETEAWHVSVHGRNGVRVNEKQVRKGESHRVSSGDIIAVAGTQMLFQLAGQNVDLPPFFLEKLRTTQESSEIGLSSSLRRPSHRDVKIESDLPQSETNGHLVPPATPAVSSAPVQPQTPETFQSKRDLGSAKKRTPYKRGMMMESTEQIDYSLDSSKDIKPGCSYASMITWAILDTPDEALSLHGIYEWIKKHYAYYRLVPSGWQNSIRHNLSLNSNFHKIPRRADEPGKGMKWTFVPESREATIAAAMRNANKAGGRASSNPASPSASAAQNNSQQGTSNDETQQQASPSQKTPPRSPTAPQDEASTPSHIASGPPLMPAYAPGQNQLPVLSDETSPVARKYNINGHITFNGSSPLLTSGAYGGTDLPMHTPAPRAYNLTVPQPNTVRLPTSHMTPTTPAPFWKLPSAMGIGSTPARWPESSPAKIGGSVNGPVPMSSSPPPATVGNGAESPTRKNGPSSAVHSSPIRAENGGTAASSQRSAGGVGPSSLRDVENSTSAQDTPDQESGGIDLLKGFTKISTFHQPPRAMSGRADSQSASATPGVQPQGQ